MSTTAKYNHQRKLTLGEVSLHDWPVCFVLILLLSLCWMNNNFTCLVKSKPVKQEVSHTMIFPLLSQCCLHPLSLEKRCQCKNSLSITLLPNHRYVLWSVMDWSITSKMFYSNGLRFHRRKKFWEIFSSRIKHNFLNPYSQEAFWGHWCSWTLALANSMQASNPQSFDHRRKHLGLGQSLSLLWPRSLRWMGVKQMPTHIGQSLHLYSPLHRKFMGKEKLSA